MKFSAGTSTDSKNYVRLKDKESIKGLFAGEPYEFKVHWNGKNDDLCTEDHNCPHCAAGLKPRFRFRINLIVKDGQNDYVAKVFEQGWNTYLSLKALNESDYNLETHLMNISREGSGVSDTKYLIIPAKGGELKPDQLRTILSAPLIDLKHKDESKPQGKGSGDIDPNFTATPAFDDSDEIPF